MSRRIDLNADLGEGYGPYTLGDDAALLDLVTSANVACGFHGGDPAIMVATASAAKARGVSIGAHPGFQDLRGFGRRVIAESAGEIEAGVAYQIGALQACAALGHHRVTHVKAHGALANLSNADADVAKALARAVLAVDRTLPLVVMPGLAVERAALDAGLAVVREIYADRAYADDGQLCARSLAGAVIHDAAEAAARVRRMVEEGAVITLSGRRIAVSIDTICVHGDTPRAVETARAVRLALGEAGFALAAFNAA
ncbi:LamB/YcsF family protein [Methylobacterium sp. SD274]|uniref:LamB/YcsF family protein n=1 Tax=Methylobacterium sp. SD274 TaxID=2782009 RepID=UPI001A97CBBB|nr:5-oxoprolinase subunit PxpA [Methylobacterium sp. SD274]MBO1019811.1 LamB/YcsF family protein [Methylobacterium sp. SD274]